MFNSESGNKENAVNAPLSQAENRSRDKIKMWQDSLQKDVDSLQSNKHAPIGLKPASGEFSAIYPLSEGLGVKWNKGADMDGELEREVCLLQFLEEHGIPAVKVHGEVFQILGRYAVIMNWLVNGKLLEAKNSENAKFMLVATLLEIDIPTGEAWALQFDRIKSEIEKKILSDDFVFPDFQKRAAALSEQFGIINTQLKNNSLAIGDMQLLMTQDGKVCVIDPLDVLKVISSVGYIKASDLQLIEPVSIRAKKQKINEAYARIVRDSFEMLSQLENHSKVISSLAKVPASQYIMKLIHPKKQDFTVKISAAEIEAGAKLSQKAVAQRLLNRGEASKTRGLPRRHKKI